MSSALVTTQVSLAYVAYFVATSSPGPSNLAIMSTAMHVGRTAALWFAAGVVSGSCFWGVLAAVGLSQLLSTFNLGLTVMKILGGAYLLWLAFKSARSASRAQGAAWGGPNPSVRPLALYLRGASMHLTNPKAILSWLAIVTLALPPDVPRHNALQVVAGCLCIGTVVFGSYALAFSTTTARALYTASRRKLEGALALVFGYAGFKMIASAAPQRLF